MRIYEGSPRQDWEEVLRTVGAFADGERIKEILFLELEAGFILQGLAQPQTVGTTDVQSTGYEIEVTDFASAEGSTKMNKTLSQRRAQAVIDYMVENHNVPLRRIGQSFGFGENQAIADNTTREGREQNRRVEVKLLVSRGINQNVEVRPVTQDNPGNEE